MTKQDDTHERRPAPGASSKRQRIAKLMARAGLCSRRDAEAWIVEGRVSVNGEVLTSPAIDVGPEDQVVVDGAPLPIAEKTRLFLFHKPRGLVTSDHDPEGRPTVADYLREHWPDGPRVVTIGRLDINTEGLLLLTNDGGLARMLELPQTGWVRRYRVRAKGTADVGALEALAAGITIDGVDYAGIEAKLDRTQGANCWLTMGLREGKNREVKRVLEHVGLEVNRLIRLSFGPFQLLDLPEGAVEEVRTRVLRDQLGPTLAAQAGVDFGDAEPVEPAKAPMVDRPGRVPRQRADVPRDDRRRPVLRREAPEEPTPVRERPLAGTRKHVGTLRNARRDEVKAGPRKRIERSDTRDRRDRAVAVERLVSTRSADRPVRRRRPGDDVPVRAETGRRGPGEGRERSETRGAPPPRRHASLSAEAKNVRRQRSGGAAPERDQAAGRRERPTEARSEARTGSRPARGGHSERRDARPERSERRPERTERTAARPERSERPAPSRERPARTNHARSDRKPTEGPRPGRPRPDRPDFEKPKFDKGGTGRAADRSAAPARGPSRSKLRSDERPRSSHDRERPAAADRPKPGRSPGSRSGAPSGAFGREGGAGKPSFGKFGPGKSGTGKAGPGKAGFGRPAGGRPTGGKPGGRPTGGKPSGRAGGGKPGGRPGGGRSGDARPPRGPARPKR